MFSKNFVFDILSVMGAGIFTKMWSYLKPLGYFKLVRVRRLGRYIDKQNYDTRTKSFVSIIKITIYLMLYLHN